MRLLGILITVCMLPPPGVSAEKPLWLVRMDAGIRYDNNVLRYSELYLQAFQNRDDPGRFHIGTTDDAILTIGARLERPLFPSHDLQTTAHGSATYARFLRNTIKNWGSFACGLRQELPFRSTLTFTYLFVPYFYLRHYKDDEWVAAGAPATDAYQPYAYSRDEVRTTLAATLPSATGVRVGVAAGRQYHNEHFTEYDARTTVWVGEVSQRMGSFRAVARYEYETSRSQHITPGKADASSEEDQVIASLSATTTVEGFRLNLEGSVAYARRCYTTRSPVEEDPLHAGRVDHSVIFTLGAGVDLTRDLGVGVQTGWRRRDATGTPANDDELSLERDYSQFQIEATASYVLRF